MSKNETIVLDTPGQIQVFQWLRFMHMIALELNTGMGHSQGPILRALYRAGLIDAELRGTKANKRMVLQAMVDGYKQAVRGYEPSDSIKKALA